MMQSVFRPPRRLATSGLDLSMFCRGGDLNTLCILKCSTGVHDTQWMQLWPSPPVVTNVLPIQVFGHGDVLELFSVKSG